MGASEGQPAVRWSRHVASEGRSYQLQDPTGEDLNRRRNAVGLSYRALAAKVGCSKPMVGFWCTGERTGMSEVMVVAFAQALGCKPEDLVVSWVEPAPAAQVGAEVVTAGA